MKRTPATTSVEAGLPGKPITGIEAAAAMPDVTICHAATRRKDGAMITAGGRVLNATGRGATLAEARDRAYALIDAIDWPGGFCRRDIGWRAL